MNSRNKCKTKVDRHIFYISLFGLKYSLLLLLRKMGVFKPFIDYKSLCIKEKYVKTLSENQIKRYIEEYYYHETGEKMNIGAPKGLNERIQWLKYYDVTPQKISCADKYEVRLYVKNKIGEANLVNLLGLYENIDEIDFLSLPERYVIKLTQGSGYNIIVRENSKKYIRKIKQSFKYWMKCDFKYNFMEKQYDKSKNKIIIEEYLGDDLDEYKFMCFNGKAEFFWIRSTQNGVLTRNFYDMEKNEIRFHFGEAPQKTNIVFYEQFDKLVYDVNCLAEGFSFVRVDTFVINDRYYIGELTFTSGAGYDSWSPEEDAISYGDLISINYINNND